jgi:SanA protein
MTSPPPLFRRWLRLLLWAGLAAALTLTGINVWMTARCINRIYTSAEAVPQTNVALVLGTIKMIGPYINRHFHVRMDAAAELYHAGKVKHLLLSGDNSRADYNEPQDMRDALIERGVPASAITCDYAGLRTLDSVVRARDIFGVTRCIIISDDFHLARALWVADLHGVTATAYYNETAPWSRSWKTRTREWLARVRAVSDEITGKEPKFGGEKVPLPVTP